MNVGAKIKLNGDLSVVSRVCTCCNGANMLKVLDLKDRDIYYCNACFTSNCACNGERIEVTEK